MPAWLKFTCEACKGIATLRLNANVIDVLAEKIQVGKPCPACGGRLSCPGGYYRKNAENLLTRMADFSPPTSAIN